LQKKKKLEKKMNSKKIQKILKFFQKILFSHFPKIL